MRLWLGWLGTGCTQTHASNKPTHQKEHTTISGPAASCKATDMICLSFYVHVDGCRADDRGLADTLFRVRWSVEFWAAGTQVLWRCAQVVFVNEGQGRFGWRAAHTAVKHAADLLRLCSESNSACSTMQVSAGADAEPLYPTSSLVWAVKLPSLLFIVCAKPFPHPLPPTRPVHPRLSAGTH